MKPNQVLVYVTENPAYRPRALWVWVSPVTHENRDIDINEYTDLLSTQYRRYRLVFNGNSRIGFNSTANLEYVATDAD